MGLESATYISELVASNPVGGVDDYATADDHLRLIKAVLKGQFPNFTAAAMNASIVELNLLVGLTAAAAELNKLDGFTGLTADLNILSGADAGGLTAAELLFVNGVTSAIQAQINGKAPTAHSHGTSEIDNDAITYAKIQNVVTDERLLGNIAGAGGIVTELSPAQVRTMINVEAGATADQSAGEIEAIVSHDNLLAFVLDKHVAHASVSIGTAAAGGLSGGGTIAATRALVINLSGLPAIEGNGIVSGDGYLVDNGGVMNRMAHSDGGIPIGTVTGTSDVLATADMNTYIEYTNAAAVTVTLNNGVGKKSNVVIIEQAGAGQVTVAGTATVNAANGKKTTKQRSVIILLCTAANTWTLFGDSTA